MRYRLRLTKRELAIYITGAGVSWIAANVALRARHPRALYWIYGIYFGALGLWSLSRIVGLLMNSQKEDSAN
jgi:hypothetical protein